MYFFESIFAVLYILKIWYNTTLTKYKYLANLTKIKKLLKTNKEVDIQAFKKEHHYIRDGHLGKDQVKGIADGGTNRHKIMSQMQRFKPMEYWKNFGQWTSTKINHE